MSFDATDIFGATAPPYLSVPPDAVAVLHEPAELVVSTNEFRSLFPPYFVLLLFCCYCLKAPPGRRRGQRPGQILIRRRRVSAPTVSAPMAGHGRPWPAMAMAMALKMRLGSVVKGFFCRFFENALFPGSGRRFFLYFNLKGGAGGGDYCKKNQKHEFSNIL